MCFTNGNFKIIGDCLDNFQNKKPLPPMLGVEPRTSNQYANHYTNLLYGSEVCEN